MMKLIVDELPEEVEDCIYAYPVKDKIGFVRHDNRCRISGAYCVDTSLCAYLGEAEVKKDE